MHSSRVEKKRHEQDDTDNRVNGKHQRGNDCADPCDQRRRRYVGQILTVAEPKIVNPRARNRRMKVVRRHQNRNERKEPTGDHTNRACLRTAQPNKVDRDNYRRYPNSGQDQPKNKSPIASSHRHRQSRSTEATKPILAEQESASLTTGSLKHGVSRRIASQHARSSMFERLGVSTFLQLRELPICVGVSGLEGAHNIGAFELIEFGHQFI